MNDAIYNITGPGMVRAIKEAHASHKKFGFVYDYDNLGRILRIGYCLKDKNTKDPILNNIIWFNPSEIQITQENTSTPEFRKACLGVEFTHPREHERHFLLSLFSDSSTQITLRNLFRIRKESVTEFMIQLEVHGIIDGKEEKRPVVRYDCAHGFIHRDMIAYGGKKTKHKLGTQNPRDAIVLAVDEMRDNRNQWLKQLGYTPLDPQTLSQPLFIQKIEEAKSTLLELFDNPERLINVQSTFVQFKDDHDYNEKIWPSPSIFVTGLISDKCRIHLQKNEGDP